MVRAVRGHRRAAACGGPERAGGSGRGSRATACCWSRISAIGCSAPRWRAERRRPSFGARRSTRWSQLQRVPVPPSTCRCRDGTSYMLPRLRPGRLRDRDRAAARLVLAGAARASRRRDASRAEFLALWAAGARPPAERCRGGWFLRDFHSPNLIWLPEREGIGQGRHARLPGRPATALPPTTWSRCCRTRAWMCRRRWKESSSPTTATQVRSARAALRRSRVRVRLRRLRRPAQHAASSGFGVRLLHRDGKPQYLAASAAHLGISAAQPAPRHAGATRGVVRASTSRSSVRDGKLPL